MTTYSRLKFERDLLSDIKSPARERSRGVGLAVGVVLLVIGTAAATAGAYYVVTGTHDRAALERFSSTFTKALQTPEGDGVMGLLAPNFAEDSTQVAGNVRDIWDAATAAGLDWDDAEAVAFGGVRTSPVEDDDTTLLLGNVYVRSAEALYAFEVSALRLDTGFALTHLWGCARLEGDVSSAKLHAAAQYRAYRNEQDPSGAVPALDTGRSFFIAFDAE